MPCLEELQDGRPFAVVKFPRERSKTGQFIIDIVSTIWLKKRDRKWYCSYPVAKTNKEVQDYAQVGKVPACNWKEHDVEVLSECVDWAQAQRHLKRGYKNENLMTDEGSKKASPVKPLSKREAAKLLDSIAPFKSNHSDSLRDRSDSKELSYDDDSLISKSGQQPKSKRARSRVQRNKSDYSNESIRPKSLSPFNPVSTSSFKSSIDDKSVPSETSSHGQSSKSANTSSRNTTCSSTNAEEPAAKKRKIQKKKDSEGQTKKLARQNDDLLRLAREQTQREEKRSKKDAPLLTDKERREKEKQHDKQERRQMEEQKEEKKRQEEQQKREEERRQKREEKERQKKEEEEMQKKEEERQKKEEERQKKEEERRKKVGRNRIIAESVPTMEDVDEMIKNCHTLRSLAEIHKALVQIQMKDNADRLATLKRNLQYDSKEKHDNIVSKVVKVLPASNVKSLEKIRANFGVDLPMKDLDTFVEFNKSLVEDETFKQNFVDYLDMKVKMYDSSKDALVKVLAELISTNVQLLYSGMGRNQKRNFSSTKVYILLESALIAQFQGSDGKILTATSRWLAGAIDRDGGKKRRAENNNQRLNS